MFICQETFFDFRFKKTGLPSQSFSSPVIYWFNVIKALFKKQR